MKELIIQNAMTALINALPPSVLVEGADALLDAIESAVERSENKIDDAVVLPLLRVIRSAFGIPDGDD